MYFPMEMLDGSTLKGPHPDGIKMRNTGLTDGVRGKALEFAPAGWVDLGEYS